jgi:NAD(P)-dependent dehydrogenase (short-subunit alcohol dehydrogenase family)
MSRRFQIDLTGFNMGLDGLFPISYIQSAKRRALVNAIHSGKEVRPLQINLMGKAAIVTGAGRGIGKAIAKALAAAKASVVVNDVDWVAAREVSKEIESSGGKAMPAKADVRIRSEIEQMVQNTIQELGRVQVLVNNAGVIVRKPAEEISEEEWDKVIDINLKGTFLCAQEVAKAMIREGKGGKIINIASIMGEVALPPRAAYCASKGGIIALTRDLAAEWAKHGITVNTLAPGWTVTEMTQSYFSQEPVRQFLLERIPLNRLGKPEDVANLAVFMASEYSEYITGQAIYVDGGWTIL